MNVFWKSLGTFFWPNKRNFIVSSWGSEAQTIIVPTIFAIFSQNKLPQKCPKEETAIRCGVENWTVFTLFFPPFFVAEIRSAFEKYSVLLDYLRPFLPPYRLLHSKFMIHLYLSSWRRTEKMKWGRYYGARNKELRYHVHLFKLCHVTDSAAFSKQFLNNKYGKKLFEKLHCIRMGRGWRNIFICRAHEDTRRTPKMFIEYLNQN